MDTRHTAVAMDTRHTAVAMNTRHTAVAMDTRHTSQNEGDEAGVFGQVESHSRS